MPLPILRAIMVSVNYYDFLEVTLPYNKEHFAEICVVTSTKDKRTQDVAHYHDCSVYITDSFYDDGADFNKWKALEEALDAYGRRGWLCIMDADILWPRRATTLLQEMGLEAGKLYTPLRYLQTDLTKPILPEAKWDTLPIHRNRKEWAGYSQIFHCNDPALPINPPWHETNWKHAGGADSYFQQLWSPQNKVRPPFQVLHLGPCGQNWSGRVTAFIDGTSPPNEQENRDKLMRLVQNRRTGKSRKGNDPYAAEKI